METFKYGANIKYPYVASWRDINKVKEKIVTKVK